MSRYRLNPTQEQETTLRQHCAHARYVWNLAVEQQSWWRPGRGATPGYYAQAAQLTEARAEFGWLAEGSQMVQQQALRGARSAGTWQRTVARAKRCSAVRPAATPNMLT